MRKFLITALFVALCSSAVLASTTFTFIDTQTGAPITDSYMLLRFYDKDWDPSDVSGATVNGSLSFIKESGEYAIGIYGDDLGTPGKDFYRDFRAQIRDGLTIPVQVLPVGSIQGRVLMDGVIASNAQLLFDCEKDFGLKYPKETDDLGYFSIAYIPTGTCLIRASFGDRFEMVNAVIRQGAKEEYVINLSQQKTSHKSLFVGVIAAFIIIAVIVLRSKKPNRKAAHEFTREEAQAAVQLVRQTPEHVVKGIKADKRIQDILATLSKDERDVVEFLIAHKFKASQPTIANKTGIPKTSLARQLIALEAKKIVSISKNRKVKEAELSDWFLEEHKKKD